MPKPGSHQLGATLIPRAPHVLMGAVTSVGNAHLTSAGINVIFTCAVAISSCGHVTRMEP